MKKTLLFFALILTLSVLLISCGGTAEKESEKDGTETEVESKTDTQSETEAETEPETTEEVPETVARPTADGQEVHAYDLYFFLPADLEPNEYNGMLGVYVFYTGQFTGVYPTGLDFSLCVTAESNTKGDLEKYARDASRQWSKVDVEPEKVEYNGHEWLRFEIDSGHVNYYTVFNDGLYELTTSIGGESQATYDAAREMVEKTLFFVINESPAIAGLSFTDAQIRG